MTELMKQERHEKLELPIGKDRTEVAEACNVRIIYHNPCMDGWVAAWCAQQGVFGQIHGMGVSPELHFYPMSYKNREEQTEILINHMKESGVPEIILIVDFSLKDQALVALDAFAQHVLVLDHHKSAKADLLAFEVADPSMNIFAARGIRVYFDMDQSGAGLAWRFLNHDKMSMRDWKDFHTPELIKLVEDRDLWRHENDPGYEHRERPVYLHLALSMYPTIESLFFDLSSHDAAENESLDSFLEKMLTEGAMLYRYESQIVDSIVRASILSDFCHDDGEGEKPPYRAVVTYAPYMLASRVCHSALDKFPGCEIAINIVPGKDGYGISFRSRKSDSVDVSEIARIYGGGGHAQAAGASVESLDALALFPYQHSTIDLQRQSEERKLQQ